MSFSAYDQDAGSLESYAMLPKRMKEGMENFFTTCILHESLSDQLPGRPFEMNQLKESGFHFATAPQDCIDAQVVRMRLAHQANGRKLDIAIDRKNSSSAYFGPRREIKLLSNRNMLLCLTMCPATQRQCTFIQ